ncbi:MAG: ribonuclease P protein component [Eubacteriales bacterium]|nr:ribonuclease P protein component [Eubacteriales bacterium]
MPKDNILRKQKDFDFVYKKGKYSASKFLVIMYCKNRMRESRYAFVASKKVGNSVSRNRARRLMKESYRLSGLEFPEGYDYIFVARKGIEDASLKEVQKSLVSAYRRIVRKKQNK